MKKMILTVLLLGSSIANSQINDFYELEAVTAKRWMCEAEGRIMTGGPGGGIWQRVRASGDTQLDAAQNALNRCYGQALRECRIGFCWQQ